MTSEAAGSVGALATVTARSVAWAFLATAGTRLISLASLVALARLLTPADFGLLAFALVYVTYAETIGDLGTAAALVYWPERTEEAARVTFAANVVLGLFWFALTWLLAPVVAAFFANPQGEAILRALAWNFPLKYLGTTHDALCQKHMRFRVRTAPELAQAVVKAGASIGLALAGFGVWSLVCGQLLGQAVWTLLLWIVVPWRPRGGAWPAGLLGPLLSYGRGIVAVNVVAAVTHHADLVIVGRMLGATALGFYQVASKVPEATITVLLWVGSKVLFPALSRLRAQEGRVGEGYLAAARYTSLVALPGALFIALLAEPLVLVAFDETWRPVIPILSGLALYGAFRSLSTPAGDVLKAMGRPGLLAGLGLLRAVFVVPALILAAGWGAPGVALTMGLLSGAFTIVNVAVTNRLAGVSARAFLGAIGPSLAGSALLALVLMGGLQVFAGQVLLCLLLGGLLGCVVYVAAIRLLSPETWREAVRSLRGPGASGLPADGASAETAVGEAGRFLVPLEPAIVRFFLRRLHIPHGFRERAGRMLALAGPTSLLWNRRGTLRVGPHGEPLPAQDGGAAAAAWLDPLRMWSSAYADGDLVRGTPLEERRWRSLLQRGDTGTSIVAFLFPWAESLSGGEPAAILKLQRIETPERSLAGEAAALARLTLHLPAPLRSTVPAVIAFREAEDVEALLLSALPGRPAYAEMQAGIRPAALSARHFQAAVGWLAAFHGATRSPDGVFEPAAEEPALREAAREADALHLDRCPLDWYEALREGCRRTPVPLVFGHGDFWARNVLLDDAGRVTGVVDWEHACFEAAPFADLCQFAVTYGLNALWSRYRRRPPEEAFRLTFLEDTPVSRAVHTHAERYCAEMGLDPGLLAPFLRRYLWTRFRRARGAEEKGLWLRFDTMLARAGRSAFSG